MTYCRIFQTAGAILVLSAGMALGQYEPPAGYYSSATGTGTTLQNNLHNIIDNHVVRSYGDARFALQTLDQDPNNPSNVILIYNGASVDGTWDSGVTWNREHQWPRGRGVDSSGPDNADLFNLRPCNPTVNNNRANEPFGTISSSYWDPDALSPSNVHDRGDCARTCFYMATRYDGSDSATTNLTLTDSFPSGNQMGDLSEMVEWHFSDPVNETERRRNHLVYSSADNPSYFQGNRNPFIDHPEFVWAIWGPTNNNSTLYVGGSVPADGASMETLAYRVIVGSAVPSQNLTLNKVGSTPTTFDVIVSGDVLSDAEGQGQAFVSGTQSTVIDVTFASAASIGQQSGTVMIDNTDLTSAGLGDGSSDGDDFIDVTLDVVDHSEASFDSGMDQDTLVIDFGTVNSASPLQTEDFTIHNLEVVAGFTASLDVDGESGSGDTAALFTDVTPVSDIEAGGAGQMFTASFDPSVGIGSYSATYTITVSDEDISGATAGTSLQVTLMGEVISVGVPTVSEWGIVVMVLCLLTAGTVVFRRGAVAMAA